MKVVKPKQTFWIGKNNKNTMPQSTKNIKRKETGKKPTTADNDEKVVGVDGDAAAAVSSTTTPSGEEKDNTTTASSSSSPVDFIRKLLAEKLGVGGGGAAADEPDQIRVLDSVSLDGIVDYIKLKKCSKIITMAGAGISTSAGIPDFRSPGSGLYHNLQKYKLPHPQAIFELDFFNSNPRPFFELAKELYPGTFRPTLSHCFIRLLADKGVLLRHYTQNIDTLERIVGVPEEKLVEAHGTFYTGHCLKCRAKYTQEWMRERIFNDEIPHCTQRKCNKGVVKPDIVFFGESLPTKFYTCSETDFVDCDLLIILGSSLVVQPFASLVDRVSDNCPRLLINREKAGHRTGIMAMIGIGGGMDFDGNNNTRDVAWLGDCDDGCQLMAEKLDWIDDLKQIKKQSDECIDNLSE